LKKVNPSIIIVIISLIPLIIRIQLVCMIVHRIMVGIIIRVHRIGPVIVRTVTVAAPMTSASSSHQISPPASDPQPDNSHYNFSDDEVLSRGFTPGASPRGEGQSPDERQTTPGSPEKIPQLKNRKKNSMKNAGYFISPSPFQ
jgi:hypothetical protein